MVMAVKKTCLVFATGVLIVLASSPLDFFLEPKSGEFWGYADLGDVLYVPSIDACAEQCLSYSGQSFKNLGCIAFNACINGSEYRCGLLGYSRQLTPENNTGCTM